MSATVNTPNKGLTSSQSDACARCEWGFVSPIRWCFLAVFVCHASWASAQESGAAERLNDGRSVRRGATSATIFWVDVPLRDALARLEKLFGETIFLDRRVDPTALVHLQMRAGSLEEVIESVAVTPKLGASRFGRTVYVGPRDAARRVAALARVRSDAVAKLPQSERAALSRKRKLAWPRYSEPRKVIESLVERAAWRVVGAEQVTHDLWAAGDLSDLTTVEQLTVLLCGFDLTFEIRPVQREIAIVPFAESEKIVVEEDPQEVRPPVTAPAAQRDGTKQVFTLRVKEKPVGPVLNELSRRLGWQIEFDEAAIAAAGKSLETRVSIAVEDVEQDELLEALLKPAGLVYERVDNRIKIGVEEKAVD
jgi:hypothetical protein